VGGSSFVINDIPTVLGIVLALPVGQIYAAQQESEVKQANAFPRCGSIFLLIDCIAKKAYCIATKRLKRGRLFANVRGRAAERSSLRRP
jgi:hypothetical protein